MTRFIIFPILMLFGSGIISGQNLVPQIQYVKSYGGERGDGGAGGFHFTTDNYILYAGCSESHYHDITCNVWDSTLNSNANPPAIGWLLKLDKQGNKIFSICYGGSLVADSSTQSQEYFDDMKPTKDGGSIVCGYSNAANFPYACSIAANGYKVLPLIKYDKDGNVQWR